MKVYESSLKVLMAIPTSFWIIGPKNGQKSQITLELMEFLKSERKDKIFLLVFNPFLFDIGIINTDTMLSCPYLSNVGTVDMVTIM